MSTTWKLLPDEFYQFVTTKVYPLKLSESFQQKYVDGYHFNLWVRRIT